MLVSNLNQNLFHRPLLRWEHNIMGVDGHLSFYLPVFVES